MSDQKKKDALLIIETLKRAEIAGISTLSQMTVLSWIAAKGGLRNKELLRCTGIKKQSISTICDRLAMLGLISSDKIYSHKRFEMFLNLTPAGREATERICL